MRAGVRQEVEFSEVEKIDRDVLDGMCSCERSFLGVER
jgi:hypothetical protein